MDLVMKLSLIDSRKIGVSPEKAKEYLYEYGKQFVNEKKQVLQFMAY